MKRTGVFIILGILLLTFFVAQQINKTEININGNVIKAVEQGENVRVYIKFKGSAVEKRGIASDVKKEVENIIKIKHEFKGKVSTFISEAELKELEKNPNIEAIDIVGTRTLLLSDSAGIINATPTWNVQLSGDNLTGKHQTVCVIDTGVNYSHPDLGGCFGSGCKVISGYDYCADNINCTTSDSDPMDNHYHGTHVSGIVAANGTITGVAPEAKLVVIKAANSSGTFWDDDIEKAIEWCVDNASAFNISVISMSLGGGLYSNHCNDDPLNDSINYAVANNISVVIAAGNDDSTSQISAPACHENATPVGGIGKDDSTFDFNRNSLVLLIAPGISIISTDSDGVGPRTLSGTSMATPHISAAIAIINQFRELEGNAVFTPTDVEDALNDSGVRINDSGGSNIEYSRINIYSTLLEIDSSGPEIIMNSPSNNLLSSNENQTFNCSATDALQLANVSFRIWNSTGGLLNETSENATNNTHELSKNLTLNNGTYTWQCIGYDNKSNFGNSSNYTIKIGAMSMSLNSPSDELYTDDSSTDFNCSVEDSVANLTNVTFFLWNSSGNLIHNETENLTGSSNSSVFSYTTTYEREYEWNCYSYDEEGNSISGSSNYTITYDNTNPVVTLETPEDEESESAGTIDFEYNVTDTNDIENCSLIIDGDMVDDDSSISKGTTQELSESLSAGTYDWKVRCRDEAGNVGTSSTWELTITSSSQDDDDDDSSSSSSSSSSTSSTTFIISDEDFEKGVSKYMKEGDLMNFKNHTLKLDDSTSTKIKAIISSDPVTLNINVGKTEKADLDDDNRYDIEVTYIQYLNNLAQVKIKEIDEAIPTREIQTDNATDNETIGIEGTANETNLSFKDITGKVTALWERMGKKGHIIFYVVLGIIGVLILGSLVYFNKERIISKIPKVDISIKKRRITKDL